MERWGNGRASPLRKVVEASGVCGHPAVLPPWRQDMNWEVGSRGSNEVPLEQQLLYPMPGRSGAFVHQSHQCSLTPRLWVSIAAWGPQEPLYPKKRRWPRPSVPTPRQPHSFISSSHQEMLTQPAASQWQAALRGGPGWHGDLCYPCSRASHATLATGRIPFLSCFPPALPHQGSE